MKNATEYGGRLAALLKKIGPGDAPPFTTVRFHPGAAPAVPAEAAEGAAAPVEAAPDPIATLVTSFLLWESTTHAAVTAYNRVLKYVVDFNDLRVSLPQEAAKIVGERYPMSVERCQRLRAVMRDIFHREHAVSLNHLRAQGKREVRRYIESLEGMVPYVSARLLLICFDTHVIPVDEQLRGRLIEAGAADESADVAELSAFLSRQVRAEDGLKVHYAIQRWVDQMAGDPLAARRPARAPAARPGRSRSSTRNASSRK